MSFADNKFRIMDIAFTDLTAYEKGWLETVRQTPHTLVVDGDEPAITAAERASNKNANLMIILDAEHNIHGIVAPAWTKRKISQLSGMDGINLYDVLNNLNNNWNPKEMVRERPDMVWCGKGGHWIDSIPCPDCR